MDVSKYLKQHWYWEKLCVWVLPNYLGSNYTQCLAALFQVLFSFLKTARKYIWSQYMSILLLIPKAFQLLWAFQTATWLGGTSKSTYLHHTPFFQSPETGIWARKGESRWSRFQVAHFFLLRTRTKSSCTPRTVVAMVPLSGGTMLKKQALLSNSAWYSGRSIGLSLGRPRFKLSLSHEVHWVTSLTLQLWG